MHVAATAKCEQQQQNIYHHVSLNLIEIDLTQVSSSKMHQVSSTNSYCSTKNLEEHVQLKKDSCGYNNSSSLLQ